MTIRIIATGGTFDKHYDELTGQLTFAQSHLPELISRARLNTECAFEVVAMLDSLDMTDLDRTKVLHACKKASESAIVVVHGTDTMPETARVLGPEIVDKTVVLTGAMIPHAIERSDAFFNLGFACAAAQLLPRGVYIAMNGQVFSWDDVRKNRERGLFEPLS